MEITKHSRIWLFSLLVLTLLVGLSSNVAAASFDDTMNEWEDKLIDIAPRVIVFIVIIIAGYIISKLLAWLIAKVLNRIGLDKAMQKVGVEATVKKMGPKSVSKMLGKMLFWFFFAMFIQIALDYAGIDSLSTILTPIVLFIPRIIIAVLIILLGLYLAEIAVSALRKALTKSSFGKDLMKLDSKGKKGGFSILTLAFMFVKIFIILIFVNIALPILAIGILTEFLTPIILLMPLILIAMAIIIIGLLVSDFIVKLVIKLLKEMGIGKLAAPIEKSMNRPGLVMKLLGVILKVMIMLIFIQIAIGVLNSTGAFNMLADLVNQFILWIPNLLIAVVIVLFGFWLAGWVSDKVKVSGKKVDFPFINPLATLVKIFIMYIVVVMALGQIGVEVPVLLIMFSVFSGALFLAIAFGFAWGSRDVFHNLISYLQSSQSLKVGQKIKVEEYEGTVEKIDKFYVILKTTTGKVRLPNAMVAKAVITETL